MAPGGTHRDIFRQGYLIFSDKAEADNAQRKYNGRKIDNFEWITKVERVD